MSFGARLAEERQRLGLKQADFAALVGTDVPKQSLYENGHRQLRAPYLSRLADAGIDVLYVLTGKRSDGPWIDERAGALLGAFTRLPPELQASLVRFVGELGRLTEKTGRGGR